MKQKIRAPKAVREFLKKIASVGGSAGTGKAKRRSSAQMSKIAKKRWAKKRRKPHSRRAAS